MRPGAGRGSALADQDGCRFIPACAGRLPFGTVAVSSDQDPMYSSGSSTASECRLSTG